MQIIRNTVFVIVVCAVVFCCLGNKFADRVLHVIDAPNKSVLEGREYQSFPEFSKETVFGGAFQDQLEQYVADLTPKRDSVLLANAAMQRAGIVSAGALFGYDTMPTFYGSNYVLDRSENSVCEKPASKGSFTKENLNDAADCYSKLIARNPDVNWIICMPDRPMSSVQNPACRLTSNVADHKWFEDELLNRIEGAKIVDGALPEGGTLSESHFNTDHHWRIQGAVETYRDVMTALDRESIDFEGLEKATDSVFYGSAARSGLCLLDGDEVYDVVYNRGGVQVRAGENEVKTAAISGGGFEKSSEFANVYSEYFHDNYAMLRYHNPTGEGRLLVVGDSYTNSIDRFFADSYEDVHVFDARYNQNTLQSVIDAGDYDDALILASCYHFVSDVQLAALR